MIVHCRLLWRVYFLRISNEGRRIPGEHLGTCTFNSLHKWHGRQPCRPSTFFCRRHHDRPTHSKVRRLSPSLPMPTERYFGNWKVVRRINNQFQSTENKGAANFPINFTTHIPKPHLQEWSNKEKVRALSFQDLLRHRFFWKPQVDWIRASCVRKLGVTKYCENLLLSSLHSLFKSFIRPITDFRCPMCADALKPLSVLLEQHA